MRTWFQNVLLAVATIRHALWVGLRFWLASYGPKPRMFNEHYEYLELVDCIFMGSTHEFRYYTREGCRVDFTRLPLETVWGKTMLKPLAVAQSKVAPRLVQGGPN
jgi:hypothetical protein